MSSTKLPAIPWCGPRQQPSTGSSDVTGQQRVLTAHPHTHTLLRMWNQVPNRCQHHEEPEEGLDKGQRNQYNFGFTEMLKLHSFLLLHRKIPWHSFSLIPLSFKPPASNLGSERKESLCFPLYLASLQVPLCRWALAKTCTRWAGGVRDLKVRKTHLQYCATLVMRSKASHFTFPRLHFPICKMGIIKPDSWDCHEDSMEWCMWWHLANTGLATASVISMRTQRHTCTQHSRPLTKSLQFHLLMWFKPVRTELLMPILG